MKRTMVYSVSRLKSYLRCPFKWKAVYIDGLKEEARHFDIGTVLHAIAENAGLWCYEASWKSMFFAKFGTNADVAWDLTDGEFRERFKTTKASIPSLAKSLSTYNSYSEPPKQVYDEIVLNEIRNHKIYDGGTVKEIMILSSILYNTTTWGFLPGETIRFEMKFGITDEWTICKFSDKEAMFRGVIDVIETESRKIRITDYKSSRTKMARSEFEADYQFKSYALFASLLVDLSKYDEIELVIKYIRFGDEESYTIKMENIEYLRNDVKWWIKSVSDEIERSVVTGEFPPKRNEYCGMCFIQGSCPLFLKNQESMLEFKVTDEQSCIDAWKRVEANKVENKILESQVKAFATGDESKMIIIDETVYLGTHVKKSSPVNTVEAAKILLKRGVKIEAILEDMTMGMDAFKRLYKSTSSDKKEQRLLSKEAEGICPTYIKSSNSFAALTVPEMESEDDNDN